MFSEDFKLCIYNYNHANLCSVEELKLCVCRYVFSEHKCIIVYGHSFNSSVNTNLHIHSFSTSSMTASQHVYNITIHSLSSVLARVMCFRVGLSILLLVLAVHLSHGQGDNDLIIVIVICVLVI